MIIPKYYEDIHTLNVNSEPVPVLLHSGFSLTGADLEEQTGDRSFLSAERRLEVPLF